MAKINPPPIQSQVIEQGTGLLTLPFILYLNSLFTGDTGTPWTPVATNLGVSGSPTLSGAYYKSGQFIDFTILVTPNGGSTTSTAGSTYFTLPFDVLDDGACLAVSGLLGSNAGMLDSATNRCYPPPWNAVTVPLTVTGRVRAR